jgi:hypothetical protein
MKKHAFLLSFVLLIPVFCSGYHVFVWNYDTLDVFYDAQVGDTIDCAYWIEQTLNQNGHTYVTATALPADLSLYDVVFVTLGFFRC